jgi:hypothetical protein
MQKEKLNEISNEIICLLEEKAKHYGDSWKMRGGIGAFMNIARKWDRLETQCKKNNYDIFYSILNDKLDEEGVKDSIIDLIGYGLLILSETITTHGTSKISTSQKLEEWQKQMMNKCANDNRYCSGMKNPFGYNEEEAS